ncbi:MAG: metallophosphoesterase [Bacteroidales bacterium]|nr:metallophosphoesterase [Bacteroidales bacterium]
MNKVMKILLGGLLIFIFISGCEEMFEFSPYAANVKEDYKKIGANNLKRVTELSVSKKGEYKFAVLSDSHYCYHELDEAIKSINSRDDIDFVIANGDIADHGYMKEYELFHERMKKLKKPYLTAIGNHDYRSNGGAIYREMYGDPNYSFRYCGDMFIIWDDVFWESNKNPDFDWLEKQLKNTSNDDNVFVICHIPPYGDQFNSKSEAKYTELMNRFDVDLSIHGHIHRYKYDKYYKDGIDYLATEAILDREFVVITVSNVDKQKENKVEIVKY